MRGTRGRRWLVLPPLLAAVLTVSGITPSSADPPGGTSGTDPTTGLGSGSLEPERLVTLITGDVVAVRPSDNGQYQAHVRKTAPRPDGQVVTFNTLGTPDGALYVIPSDAATAVAAGTVDRDLFDLRYLVDHGYADDEAANLPLIVGYPDQPSARAVPDRAEALAATERVRPLPAIGGFAAAVPKADATDFWTSLRPATGGSGFAPSADLRGGVAHVWLDREVHATLDESVPMIGAPEVWADGYDGTGVTIAVLDTGIDLTHPDLAGKVTDSAVFTGEASVTDGNGHGTHVASTITGSGAASDGRYKGVAPGVDLVVGKVLDNSGHGTASDLIEGMTWAAPRADIVSMSIGSDGPGDADDPMSLAVDQLTESTGALFVIAAGNSGRSGSQTIETPGAAREALTVAAVTKQDDLADFSSRGPVRMSKTLKPDIAAPGVDIVAARASGTGLGRVVDDHYTALDGTSMATPHVAGSAALLAQEHPDWDADELKSALMGSAIDDGYTVFEQGAGRLDVAAASHRTLLGDPSIDFGDLEFPQTEAVSAPLTLTNTGTEDLTVSLATDVTDSAGDRAPVSVSQDSATVPAGGSTQVTVTYDATRGADGPVQGLVTVTDQASGASLLRVPVGAYKSPEGHNLRIMITPPDGWPSPRATMGNSPVVVLRLDKPQEPMFLPFSLDQDVVVPDGVYMVYSQVFAYYDADTGDYAFAWMLEPEFTVDGADAELTLRADQAKPLVATADRTTEQRSASLAVIRETGYGGNYWIPDISHSFGMSMPYDGVRTGLRVTPTEPVSVGGLRAVAGFDLAEPLVSLEFGGRDHTTFYPAYADWEFDYVFTQPKLDAGRDRVEVVDVGSASAEELAEVDLRGKLALATRPWDDPNGFLFANADSAQPLFTRLRDAGAIGVITALDHEGRTGWCALASCQSLQDRDIPLPVLTVGPGEGARLRELVANGPRRVTLTVRDSARYDYQLRTTVADRIPDQPTFRFHDRDLATEHTRFHAERPGYMSDEIHALGGDGVDSSRTEMVPTPSERTTYYTASPDLVWWHVAREAHPDEAGLQGIGMQTYQYHPRPERTEYDFFAAPRVPGATELDPRMPAEVLPGSTGACSLCRGGRVLIPLLADTYTDPGAFEFNLLTPPDPRLYREDGTEVPRSPRLGPILSWDLGGSPEPARYRMTTSRTSEWLSYPSRVDTEWEFDSREPTEQEIPAGTECYDSFDDGSIGPCQVSRVERILMLRYDMTDMLALDNSALAPGVGLVTVTPYRQAGAPDPRVTHLTAKASYDHGEHWVPTIVVPHRDGGYGLLIVHPWPSEDQDTVSLKVSATDSDGNTVTQTVFDAYRLRDLFEGWHPRNME